MNMVTTRKLKVKYLVAKNCWSKERQQHIDKYLKSGSKKLALILWMLSSVLQQNVQQKQTKIKQQVNNKTSNKKKQKIVFFIGFRALAVQVNLKCKTLTDWSYWYLPLSHLVFVFILINVLSFGLACTHYCQQICSSSVGWQKSIFSCKSFLCSLKHTYTHNLNATYLQLNTASIIHICKNINMYY